MPPTKILLAMLEPCWRYFSLLGPLGSIWRILLRFLSLWAGFCGSWTAPGSILEGFRRVWERFWKSQGLIFRVFFARGRFQCEKACDVQKPQFFLGFCMVFTHRKLVARAPEPRKIVPGACRTALPANIVLQTRLGVDSGRVWRSIGRRLAGFCSLLGGPWDLLGASWASRCHILGALGCLLAALWSFRAAFGLPVPSQASILEGLGTSLNPLKSKPEAAQGAKMRP